MSRAQGKYDDVFSWGSPHDLGKAAFSHWLKERLPKSPAAHRQELAALFAKHAAELVPDYVVDSRGGEELILQVARIIDGVRFIATTPIWGDLVCLSEGRFKNDIWSGTDRDRRLLAAAARAVREFLAGEQATSYKAA